MELFEEDRRVWLGENAAALFDSAAMAASIDSPFWFMI